MKKNQTDISWIEDQVICLYAKGWITRDIISNSLRKYIWITDIKYAYSERVKNRPLEAVYPITFMDVVHYKVKQDIEL